MEHACGDVMGQLHPAQTTPGQKKAQHQFTKAEENIGSFSAQACMPDAGTSSSGGGQRKTPLADSCGCRKL
jgi:hypothetical protein